MIITDAGLAGACIVELERREDERGFFARSWSVGEFAAHGLNASLVECDISFNHRRGTLRGMHYQAAPHAQAKVVRCTAGAIYDCIIDLRPDSPTFTRWVGVELNAENRRALYVPEGFAHGFQTLVDGAEVAYQMSAVHVADAERGVRWDDPAFGIIWPEPVRVISERDRTYPDFVTQAAR